jgi:hypothetical protein
MNSNVVIAIITGGSALVGAVIGGLITAQATKRATAHANEHALRLERQKYDAFIYGVVLGFRAEISTSWDFYVKQFGAIIEELPGGEPFDYIYGLYLSYFTVYESNASLLGQIPDDNLRQAIVTTYAVARPLFDTHLLNNELIRRRDSLQAIRDETGSRNLDAQINAASTSFKGKVAAVKENYLEMKRLVPDLLKRIDKFVSTLR